MFRRVGSSRVQKKRPAEERGELEDDYNKINGRIHILRGPVVVGLLGLSFSWILKVQQRSLSQIFIRNDDTPLDSQVATKLSLLRPWECWL